MVQDFDVRCLESFFLLSTLLRVLRQSIGRSISLALMVINSKMVTKEFLSPVDLSEAQNLRVHKLL